MKYPQDYYDYKRAKENADYSLAEANSKLEDNFQRVIKIIFKELKIVGTAEFKDCDHNKCNYKTDGDNLYSNYKYSFPTFFLKCLKKILLNILELKH